MTGRLLRLDSLLIRHAPAKGRAKPLTIAIHGDGDPLTLSCRAADVQTFLALQRRVMDDAGVWLEWPGQSSSARTAARQWRELVGEAMG